MTTSLSKSTIPEFNPTESYMSPRQAPRVKPEAEANYRRSHGTLNIGDWAIEAKDWESYRPAHKLTNEIAQKAYNRNRGCMNELLTGYCENPPIMRKGPRITKEAYANFLRNKGCVASACFKDYGHDIQTTVHNPKVSYEGIANMEKNRGSSMNTLLANYGMRSMSARPVPRVKQEATENFRANNGSNLAKTLQQVPPSSRPSSSQFFRPF